MAIAEKAAETREIPQVLDRKQVLETAGITLSELKLTILGPTAIPEEQAFAYRQVQGIMSSAFSILVAERPIDPDIPQTRHRFLNSTELLAAGITLSAARLVTSKNSTATPEEQALAHTAFLQVQETMFNAYEALVYPIVQNFTYLYRRHCLEPRDADQAGREGLVKAIGNYDYTRGGEAEFLKYARLRIRAALVEEIRGLGALTRTGITINREIKAAFDELAQESGQEPTLQEITGKLIADDKLPVDRALVEAVLNAAQGTSRLDEVRGDPDSDDEPLTLMGKIADSDPDPLNQVVEIEQRELIATAIRDLRTKGARGGITDREFLILRKWLPDLFHELFPEECPEGEEPLGLREIGELVNVSYSRVHQLVGRSLMRIYNYLTLRKLLS